MCGDLRELHAKHCRSKRGTPFYLTSASHPLTVNSRSTRRLKPGNLMERYPKGCACRHVRNETKKRVRMRTLFVVTGWRSAIEKIAPHRPHVRQQIKRHRPVFQTAASSRPDRGGFRPIPAGWRHQRPPPGARAAHAALALLRRSPTGLQRFFPDRS